MPSSSAEGGCCIAQLAVHNLLLKDATGLVVHLSMSALSMSSGQLSEWQMWSRCIGLTVKELAQLQQFMTANCQLNPGLQGTGAVAVATKHGAKQTNAKFAAAADKLPLPPVLQRLECIFAALNVLYTLLLNNHIQASSSGCLI